MSANGYRTVCIIELNTGVGLVITSVGHLQPNSTIQSDNVGNRLNAYETLRHNFLSVPQLSKNISHYPVASFQP